MRAKQPILFLILNAATRPANANKEMLEVNKVDLLTPLSAIGSTYIQLVTVANQLFCI